MSGNNSISAHSSSSGITCGSARRKSYLNYQHQYMIPNDNNPSCNGADHHSSSTGGRYSPHPNELFLSHNTKLTLQPSSDESLSCCLPPPSPAPHNDRFCGSNNLTPSPSVGASEVPDSFITTHPNHHQMQQSLSTSTSTSSLSTNSAAGQHHHSNKFNISSSLGSNRPASPSSSRFRDRFREKHPITSSNVIDGTRTVHQPHATALSNDTYSYLNASTAHTPVKRYVPTPPPHDLYNHGRNDVVNNGSISQDMCTLPSYRLRTRCCEQGQQVPLAAPQQSHPVESHILSVAEYYTTSPRTRPGIGNYSYKNIMSVSANGNESPNPHSHFLQQEQPVQNVSALRPNCNYNATVSTLSTPASPSSAITVQSSNLCGRQLVSSSRPDYVGQTPNIDFVNVSTNGNSVNKGPHILSPTVMSSNEEGSRSHIQNNETVAATNISASTCLHCNTTRRTTGVHQTTQTTGPISPVPIQQPQISAANHCQQDQKLTSSSSSTVTPGTSETPLSPLSSTAVFEGQQLRYQQVPSSIHIRKISQVEEISGKNSLPQPASHSQALSSQQALAPPTSNSMSQPQRFSTVTKKKRISQYLRREIARYFGVEESKEAEEEALWRARQRRLALRRFGALKTERELQSSSLNDNGIIHCHVQADSGFSHHHNLAASERPDILPAHDSTNANNCAMLANDGIALENLDFQPGDLVERKASVINMLSSSVTYIVNALSGGRRLRSRPRQWSRSFAPAHIYRPQDTNDDDELFQGLTALQEDEVFFDSPNTTENGNGLSIGNTENSVENQMQVLQNAVKVNITDQQRHQNQIFMGERVQGWRTTSFMGSGNTIANQENILSQAQLNQQQPSPAVPNSLQRNNSRSMRISAQLLDGVLENSRRALVPQRSNQKLFSILDLDDRTDHRPFFTYWINTVQILVLFLSLVCYGIGPIGFGLEQRTGQVLVTSLSLQTVQHSEQRNIWIGPRNFDLVHMGAKFATCMRRDVKIMDVLFKTRRQERETACCIRNDDSGCVQSSQADCSVRGLFPSKSISTWKKWSPGESGPGGRISGSVCGLDPKYCDAPASIAPYEWPDDITKWPICRKANSFSQRFRFKDHTAEHMICEVIGHPCCTGIFGECRITTKEYCDFVNGFFHEEASLCSQISCLSNVCGMLPFFSVEIPDQVYRLFTALCLHAGILHLAITVAFQQVFLADLERLIGPIRTAMVYLCSGVAGNLTSALLVPYKPEVGPLASLTGVVSSLIVLLVLTHWKQLRKPHIALMKLIFIGALLFVLGTLPWQLNVFGLFAGMISGVFLTIAMVPFVSITSYVRKSKINLIWSCVFFHIFLYSFMLVLFYVFPTELTNLNFGEVLTNTFNTNIGNNRIGSIGDGGLNSETNMEHGTDAFSEIGQLQHQDHSIMFYPENYLVNTASAFQIIDRTKAMTSRNRILQSSIKKDANNIKNLTSLRNIIFFNDSKKHFVNKKNCKILERNLKNTTNEFLFDKDRNKIIQYFNEDFVAPNRSINNASSLLLYRNANKLGSKLSNHSKLIDEKFALFLSEKTESNQNSAHHESTSDREIETT